MNKLLSEQIRVFVLTEKNFAAKCKQIPNLDVKLFKEICLSYGFPITVVRELNYTDPLFRDVYYNYLSTMHFDISRSCQRLLLFDKKFRYSDFINSGKAIEDERQQSFIGTIVIRPAYVSVKPEEVQMTLSRTLLNPYKMRRKKNGGSANIRTATYEATVFGYTYRVDAFPFSNQHGDAVRCAEISLWALLEYYGTRYGVYKTILPSDIFREVSKTATERHLPSSGLNPFQISSLLHTFGFESQVYRREVFTRDFYFEAEAPANPGPTEKYICKPDIYAFMEQLYKKVFHCYVLSGMPLSVIVQPSQNASVSHAINVIGYLPVDFSCKADVLSNLSEGIFTDGTLYYLDSSELYTKYVVMDDNCPPYQICEFDKFSANSNAVAAAFTVPLPKHVYLDAEKILTFAETVLMQYLSEHIRTALERLEIDNSKSNPLVFRYYLATTKGFKRFRAKSAPGTDEKLFYTNVAYPKFVWVVEFGPLDAFVKGRILGEVVFDPTSSAVAAFASIISIRIADFGYFRLQNTAVHDMMRVPVDNMRCLYPYYISSSNNSSSGSADDAKGSDADG